MLQVSCSGTPFEIGNIHGKVAADQVKGSRIFYEEFFQKQTKKSWAEVRKAALDFVPYLQDKWPEYVEEMRGLAEGAGVDFEDVLALNVRTEIGYGLLNDGCTAFAWKTDSTSFLGQNWDWNLAQAKNLINLRISQPGKPSISMITEAGIIGKIGINSAGVGVTLNAISAPGMNVKKLPTHLALRTVLNSTSQQEARALLLDTGVAAACHITVADFASGGVGLECSSADIVELDMKDGICTHTNHMLRPHAIQDRVLLSDSPFRAERVQELLSNLAENSTIGDLRNVLKDEKNHPAAICRAEGGNDTLSTLFSIMMDLRNKYAIVKVGRPTEDGEEIELMP